MSWGYNYYSGGFAREFARVKTALFDEAWSKLSPLARGAVVHTLSPSYDSRDEYAGVYVDKVGQEVAQELVDAKIARFSIVRPKGAEKTRVILTEESRSFVLRIKDLARLKPLRTEEVGLALQYVFGLFGRDIDSRIRKILTDAGYRASSISQDVEGYVLSAEWQGIALAHLKNSLAEKIVGYLREKAQPVPIAQVVEHFAKGATTRKDVEAAIGGLVETLVLFEDLDPTSLDLMIGFSPVVWKLQATAAMFQRTPLGPLQVVPASEVEAEGPATGLLVNDIRAFLMEVLATPPAIRQDGNLYQKDINRIQATLVPWPEWILKPLDIREGDRVWDAATWSKQLGFVETPQVSSKVTARITEVGREWLALPPNRQYEELYRRLREELAEPSYDDYYSVDYTYLATTTDRFRPGPANDLGFIGVPVAVEFRSKDAKKKTGHARGSKASAGFDPTNREFIRKILADLLSELPADGYVRIEDFLRPAVLKTPHPLLGGRDFKDVNFWYDGVLLPQLEHKVRATWGVAVLAHLYQRLIPFDAVLLAQAKDGGALVRASPRLMAYYGKAKLPSEPVAVSASSVIVQPDFTVTVIGLATSAAATLSAFADRVQGHTGTGALTFKLTRDSIRRAVTQSKLTGAEIVRSLEGLVSKSLPPNVATEIQTWADWVRKVNVEDVLLIRCPDVETTARVIAALGKTSERISDHYVAVKLAKISATERQKLLNQGVVITTERIALPVDAKPEPKPKATAKKAAKPKKLKK